MRCHHDGITPMVGHRCLRCSAAVAGPSVAAHQRSDNVHRQVSRVIDDIARRQAPVLRVIGHSSVAAAQTKNMSRILLRQASPVSGILSCWGSTNDGFRFPSENRIG